MPSSSYESLTVFPGWDQCDDSCIERIQSLMAPKCAVFLVVEGNQVMNAADFLFKLTQVDHGAYVFKLWQRQTTKKVPKTVRQGPRGCVVADTVQIWALETNRVEMQGNRTFQTVVAQKPTKAKGTQPAIQLSLPPYIHRSPLPSLHLFVRGSSVRPLR